MDFTLTEEQQIFRDSVARFVAEAYDFQRRRAIVVEGPGFLEEHWARFAELGWLAAPFPETYGGLGGGADEIMVTMEQFGRGLVVSPYLSTILLGGHLVLFAGSEAQKAAILPRIAAGELRLAFTYAEPQAHYDLNDVATTARRDGDGWILDGAKAVVFQAESAQMLIVSARSAGGRRDAEGIGLFMVETGAPGVSMCHYRTQDGGSASEVAFDGVRVAAEAVLGDPEGALPVIERVADHANAALCAEAAAIMWEIQERTVDYHKTREQFGQPLSKFQALQHRLVDLYAKCQLAQSMAYDATCALAIEDAGARRRAVSGAKFEIARYGRDAGQEGVQLHGGIGMTDDFIIGHYFKRLTMINATFGDAAYHLARYRAQAA